MVAATAGFIIIIRAVGLSPVVFHACWSFVGFFGFGVGVGVGDEGLLVGIGCGGSFGDWVEEGGVCSLDGEMMAKFSSSVLLCLGELDIVIKNNGIIQAMKLR